MEDHLIITWINTLCSDRNCTSIDDLLNGEILYEIVAQIDARIDLNMIKKNTDNWVLIQNNYKRIITCLNNFFLERKNINCKIETQVDSKEIAQNKNIAHIKKLLEYIVVASIEIPSIIEKILTMDPVVQGHLFSIISSFESYPTLSNAAQKVSEVDNERVDNLEKEIKAKELALEAANVKFDELEELYEKKIKENDQLSEKVDKLQKKMEKLMFVKEENETLKSTMRSIEHQHQLQMTEMLAKENAKMSSNASAAHSISLQEIGNLHEEIESLKEKIQQLKKENVELNQQHQYQIKELKEEIDVLKEKESELTSMTTKHNNLKAKISDLQKYKEIANQFEEKYNNLLVSHSVLQSDNKILSQTNKNLSAYKDMNLQLNNEKEELQKKLDLQNDRISILEKSNQELHHKVVSQSAELSQLTQQSRTLSEAHEDATPISFSEPESSFEDANLEEEMQSLKREMLVLKAQNESYISKLSLQSELEIENAKLKEHTFSLQEEIAQLISQIELLSQQSLKSQTEVVNRDVENTEVITKNLQPDISTEIEQKVESERDENQVIAQLEQRIRELEVELKMVSLSYNMLSTRLSSCNNSTLRQLITSPTPLTFQRIQC